MLRAGSGAPWLLEIYLKFLEGIPCAGRVPPGFLKTCFVHIIANPCSYIESLLRESPLTGHKYIPAPAFPAFMDVIDEADENKGSSLSTLPVRARLASGVPHRLLIRSNLSITLT